MPRRKKAATEASNLAATSQRHLPPLAPKTKTPPVRVKSSQIQLWKFLPRAAWRNRVSGCFVFGCCIVPCKLRTHHQYDPRKSYRHLSNAGHRHPNVARPAIVCTLGSEIDSLPSLPINDLDENSLRRLFHLHFTRDFHRISAIVLPPALSELEKNKIIAVREANLKTAFSDPLYCLNLIASTELQNVYAGQQQDDFLKRLRAKLLPMFIEKLNNFTPADLQAVMVIMNTIIQFNLLFDDLSILIRHRQALSILVPKGGGLYNIKHDRSLRIFMVLDRTVAVCLHEKPLYVRRIDRSLLIPNNLAERYGSGTDIELKVIESDVVHFCKDCCRAIELLEEVKWGFNFEITACYDFSSSKIHYLYFLKEVIANDFAHLQASDFPKTPKSNIVLLAANLVQYSVLHDYYLVPFGRLIADRLRDNLKLCGGFEDWKGMGNVLRWIFCVLLCLPRDWSGKKWAFDSYLHLLDKSYGPGNWTRDWIEIEVRNVSRFVWSDTRLGGQLKSVLREIDLIRSAHTIPVHKTMIVKQEDGTVARVGQDVYIVPTERQEMAMY